MSRIITVAGEIEKKDCRMLLSHEHLFIDLANQVAAGAERRHITSADRPGLLCDPYAMQDNLLLDRFDLAAEECRNLIELGCNTVVDCSLREIGRDPQKLYSLSRETGMNIVMGCGWYTGDTHPEETASCSVEELAERLLFEIQNGVGTSGIRPGIIGEIGTGKEILPREWKALEAAAAAQKRCGLAVQIHIYPWCTNGLDVAKKMMQWGVAPERIVICHSDVEPDTEYILELLKLGVFVQLDNFGKEFTPAAGGFAAGNFVRDSQRVELALWIIRSGYGKQLLLTNDICLKCMLKEFGGSGYSHIFENILPALEGQGVERQYIQEVILRDNPLRMLTGE